MRIDPSPTSAAPKTPSRLFSRVGKFFYMLVKIPFKITLRVIMIAIVLAAFIVIIRTGIWHVPVASDILYRKPEPLHNVGIKPFSVKLLEIKASEAIASTSDGNADFDITEAELTQLVRDFSGNDARLTELTFSITPEYIEAYGEIPRAHPVVLRSNIFPRVEDHVLAYDMMSVHVGQVGIPQSLISSDIISRFTPSLFSTLQETALLDSITLGDQVMTVTMRSL